MLEAITGVPLDAAGTARRADRLLVVEPRPGRRAQFGDDWRMLRDGSRSIYLNRNPPSAPWQLVAVVHQERHFARMARRVSGLRRRPAADDPVRQQQPDRFNLRLELRDIELNPALGPEAFEVSVPASAQPITLEELRRAGPLRDESR